MRLLPRRDSLLGYAYARTGSVVKASNVVAFMVSWDVCRRSLGHEPTVAEYSEWWRQSERGSYKELARFREVFPDERNPSRILDLVADEWDRSRGVKALGDVPSRTVAA